MPGKLDKGIELLAEQPGTGREARKGDRVTYNCRLFLRQGDEVTTDYETLARYPERLESRMVDDRELIDHTTILGKRRPIAAVEKSLTGMCEGGYREVLASPHLCYGAKGQGEVIPPDAMLRIQLWLRKVS